MCIRDRMALMSLVVFSSILTSSGVNDIHGSSIIPRDATLAARGGSETKAPIRVEMGESERPLEKQPLRVASRETKTLAVILLMLKDGRGAR